MLNYIHNGQSLLLLFLTQVVMWSKGVQSFRCELWGNSIKWTLVLITLAFHSFLVYYETTPLLYFWFMFSILHFFHAYRARKTIVESNQFTSDEIWHLMNQSLCFYYMRSQNVAELNIKMYAAFFCLYFVLLFGSIAGFPCNKPLYYLGSFMASFFVFSLRPSYDPYSIFFFMTSYYFVVVSITYKNPFGRRLTLLNIAGNAFISEAFLLHLLHNHLC